MKLIFTRKGSKTFDIFSINDHCSSLSCRVLASRLSVTLSSLKTLVIAHRCSTRRSNMPWTEFHLVFTHCMSLCFGRLCCSCFVDRVWDARTECLKWPTRRLAPPIRDFNVCEEFSPVFTQSCNVWAVHGISGASTASPIVRTFDALSCTTAQTFGATSQYVNTRTSWAWRAGAV